MPTPVLLRRSRLATLTLAVALALSGCASRHSPKPSDSTAVETPAVPRTMTAERRAAHLASFDEVWQTVKDNHWDVAKVGPAWDQARAELRPAVENATTEDDARSAISELLARLEQSHFGLLPETVAEVVSPGAESSEGGEGAVGITLEIVDHQAVVTRVDDNSPAQASGIKPGWVLLELAKRGPVAKLLSTIEKEYAGKPIQGFLAVRTLSSELDGPVGSSVQAVFLDAADQRRQVTLTRAARPGEPSRLGNLPPMHVLAERRTLPGGIAYVRFNYFLDPVKVMGVVNQAAGEAVASGAPGFILDLRDNPGGLGAMAMGVGGWFVTTPGLKLGTMITRESTLNFVLSPRPKPYTGPLAVLVNSSSVSTSEILAGGLKDLKRSRTFGTRTAGAALPSRITKLPSGDGFQYAVANYVSASGQVLEGTGVEPDETVTPSRSALSEGQDPVLDAAVRWINAQPR